MITKEKIASFCVNSNGDKDLAEQIARQFERAGFPKTYLWTTTAPFVYASLDDSEGPNVSTCYPNSPAHKELTETTLPELTKMVDEMLGDEYAIVREFIEYRMEFRGVDSETKKGILENFKRHRTKHTVTLDELKECYAKVEGIEVDKIEVKEEGK